MLEKGFSPRQIVQIPNGISVADFVPPDAARERYRKILGFHQEQKVVMFVGRLLPKKGVDLLLRAWAKVCQEHPTAHLVILGDGPFRAELSALADTLGVSKHVSFQGHVDNVSHYLWAADVFVLPSKAEGLSNALMEAMAAGLPCVASKVGGNIDLITDGENGLLFDSGNEAQLVAALSNLLRNEAEARKLGRKARKTVETEFSLSSVVAQYINLYKRLLKNGEGE